MSNYYAKTKHPITGEWKRAQWRDDYFGNHNYGVCFDGETEVYDDREHHMETVPDEPAPTPFTPKRGDRVQVREHEEGEWKERIYIATIEGSDEPHVAVSVSSEEEFADGRTFAARYWAHMRPIPTKTTLTKAQIAYKFGISVEELEITE